MISEHNNGKLVGVFYFLNFHFFVIKRVKIHRSIDKRGKSSLIYFPSGLKTSIKIEFHGGKE